LKYNRNKAIERLIDNAVDNVSQFVLQGLDDDLREYVRRAEGLEELDDDTLKNLLEVAFGDEVNE